ncbi:pyruvate dehydrogenase E2 component [Fistulifera solaris]|uniref:Dihydrolipoamide acetyltransferase component of pyruvate dehydrogenase complex n=1 Tax=Fistulifera solaris TaxID=1519565 RepID=A0A1Z5KF56_FISSO|nr:pyruvate dehydrogenase E2 component [Fistulifera solaris]|eukprot:GAX24950.1 pyruvate dehydrogenase E2 component [Fistulifera solaris]
MKFLTASVAALALLSSSQAFAPAVKPSRIKITQLFAGTKITMPALSSTMKEGKVVSWLKNEGDEIEAGEAIMVVESDKADMDVEAFEDGIIAKIIVQEGEMAPVGEAVALIAADSSEVEAVLAEFNAGGSGGDATSAAAPPAAAPATTAAAAPEVPFSKIDMPALSSTMKEGKVVSWLKSEGDAISAGEAIMVVESDKADMDVEAFEDGFLAAIITQEGESGAVGAPVALIAENESDIPALQAYAATLSGAAPPAAAAAPAAAAPVAAAAPKAAPAAATPAKADGERLFASPLARNRAKELGVDISLVTGTGPEGRITAADVEAVASGEAKVKKPAASASSKPSWTPAAGVVAATPTARALAKKAKLDLATIKGTGEFGRVTADDVLIATGQKEPERKKVVRPGAAVVEMPSGPVAMTGMQKAVSNNMMATMSTPGFQVSRDIEMDNFDALYQNVKGKGISVSALLAKAVALAIEKYPIINSSFSPENGGTIVYKKDINIAMAVAIEGGLITPCLKFANERSVEDLAENWKELVEKARKGGLKPDEYQSGTFSISNMGMFGVTQFGSILPNGTGGILAIGATREVIVPCKQAVLGMKKVKQMTVTLTCDHRQIYGSDAALFLKELANIMENNVNRLTQ